MDQVREAITSLELGEDEFLCFISHHKGGAGKDARVLKTRLSEMMGVPVEKIFLDSDQTGLNLNSLLAHIRKSRVVVLLQTAQTLLRPYVIGEMVAAIKEGIPIVAVIIRDGGYDFARMVTYLSAPDIRLRLNEDNPGSVEVLERQGIDMEEVGTILRQHIPQIVSIELDLHASEKRIRVAVEEIAEAILAALSPNSSGRVVFSNEKKTPSVQWLSITRANGDKYEGECVNGKPEGNGMTIRMNGTRHDGSYKDAQPDGPGREFDRQGVLVFEGAFKNGERWEGRGKALHSNGQLSFEGSYMKGEHWEGHGNELHPNGQRKFEGTYKNCVREGPCKEFHPNGQLSFEGAYKSGKRDGPGRELDLKGKLSFRGSYKDDKREGYGQEFNLKNNLGSHNTLRGQNTSTREIMSFQGTYKNGVREGRGTEYQFNGKIRFEGEYKDDKREGLGKEFGANGELEFEGTFKDGKREGFGQEIGSKPNLWFGVNNTSTFGSTGKTTFQGMYVNGTREGPGKEFGLNGTVIFEGEYKGGARVGPGKEFDANGEVDFDGVYRSGARWEGHGRHGWSIAVYRDGRMQLEGVASPKIE